MSNRIKELRSNSGLTLKQLSEAVGIGKSTLASYESRGVVPRVDKAKILADYFEVSTEYLQGNSDEKQNSLNRTKNNLNIKNKQFEKINYELIESQHFYDKLKEEYRLFKKSPFGTAPNTYLKELLKKYSIDIDKLLTPEDFSSYYENYLEEIAKNNLLLANKRDLLAQDISELQNIKDNLKTGKIFSIKDRVNPEFSENGISQFQISETLKAIPYILDYNSTMKILEYAKMLSEKKENRFPSENL